MVKNKFLFLLTAVVLVFLTYFFIPNKLEFYGKVVDQHGQPVPKARIALHTWGNFLVLGGTSHYTVTTNRDGLFKFSTKFGHTMIVDDIKKDGYEVGRRSKISKAHYFDAMNVEGKSLVIEKDSPVIFKIRKKGKLVYNYTSSIRFEVTLDDQEKGVCYDFLNGRKYLKNETHKKFNNTVRFHDLEVSFVTIDGQKWLKMAVQEGDGGVMFSGENLYEAPATGYAPFILLNESNVHMDELFVYVASRKGRIKTKINFGTNNDIFFKEIQNRKSFFSSGETFTNPFGKNSFEAAKKIPNDIKEYMNKKRLWTEQYPYAIIPEPYYDFQE